MNDTNESKISEYKTEEDLISSLLANNYSLKVTQAFIVSVNTYEQDMIEVGNEKKIKTKDRLDYFNHVPMLSLLGENHRLPLFHMDKSFIWLNGL